jgi:general stress protein YciG
VSPSRENPHERATTDEEPGRKRKPRGFAVMDPKLVRQLASRGGRAAHAAGVARKFTSEEARNAGRKGGAAAQARRREKLEEDGVE